MKHPIGQTSNGVSVYINLLNSAAGAAVSRQPRLLELAKRVLAQSSAQSPVVRIESNMGQAVGHNFVVKTGADDTVLYARLAHATAYSRFVKNGKPLVSKYLSLILHRDASGAYELSDIWIGRLRPPQPGTDAETPASRSYWQEHAYVLDTYTVQPRTVTKVCPY